MVVSLGFLKLKCALSETSALYEGLALSVQLMIENLA